MEGNLEKNKHNFININRNSRCRNRDIAGQFLFNITRISIYNRGIAYNKQRRYERKDKKIRKVMFKAAGNDKKAE